MSKATKAVRYDEIEGKTVASAGFSWGTMLIAFTDGTVLALSADSEDGGAEIDFAQTDIDLLGSKWRSDALDAGLITHDEWKAACKANARLIAAAPDLLAACGAAMKVLPSLGVNNWPPGHALKKDAICNLQSAIAKAKGEV